MENAVQEGRGFWPARRLKSKTFARVRTIQYTLRRNCSTDWASPGQVPDVGGELRIFADSETDSYSFRPALWNLAKALATNIPAKDLRSGIAWW